MKIACFGYSTKRCGREFGRIRTNLMPMGPDPVFTPLSGRGGFLCLPMLGRAHIHPVAMQLQSELRIPLRYKEPLKGSGDREIHSAIHLLKRAIEVNCAFRSDRAVNVGGDNFIDTDFVLKSGADGI
jgi:hypothetical protein